MNISGRQYLSGMKGTFQVRTTQVRNVHLLFFNYIKGNFSLSKFSFNKSYETMSSNVWDGTMLIDVLSLSKTPKNLVNFEYSAHR